MITLYHGTSAARLDSIFVQGLIPQYKCNWTSEGKVPGFPGVYLTELEDTGNSLRADWYGLRAAIVDNHDEYAVLKVVVNEDNLYPDENLLAKKKDNLIYPDDMKEAIREIRFSKIRWKEGLETSGVIHEFPISPEMISLYKKDKLKNNQWYWTIEDTGTIKEMDIKLECWAYANANGYVTNHCTQKVKLDRIERGYPFKIVNI